MANMIPGRSKNGSDLALGSPVISARPTLSELVSAIEEASRQKPKPRVTIKNFARENVLRLRETQKLCRNSQATAHASPLKASCRPKTGITEKSAHTASPVPLCTNRITQTSDSGISSIHISSRITANRSNQEGIPKLRIVGKDLRANKLDDESTCVEGKEKRLQPKSPQTQKLVRTSSAPSLASAQSGVSRAEWQLPKKYCFGSVPKYLVDRKKQWREDALEKKKQEDWENSAPPGHEVIPEDRRLETLRQLNEKYDELLKKMTALPVRMDTLRVCQLREDLEKQLVKVEEAIKIFTQSKVYLKIDV